MQEKITDVLAGLLMAFGVIIKPYLFWKYDIHFGKICSSETEIYSGDTWVCRVEDGEEEYAAIAACMAHNRIVQFLIGR